MERAVGVRGVEAGLEEAAAGGGADGNPTRRIPIISPFCRDCRTRGWGRGWLKFDASHDLPRHNQSTYIHRPPPPRGPASLELSSVRFDSENRHAKLDIKTRPEFPVEFRETGDFNRRNRDRLALIAAVVVYNVDFCPELFFLHENGGVVRGE